MRNNSAVSIAQPRGSQPCIIRSQRVSSYPATLEVWSHWVVTVTGWFQFFAVIVAELYRSR